MPTYKRYVILEVEVEVDALFDAKLGKNLESMGGVPVIHPYDDDVAHEWELELRIAATMDEALVVVDSDSALGLASYRYVDHGSDLREIAKAILSGVCDPFILDNITPVTEVEMIHNSPADPVNNPVKDHTKLNMHVNDITEQVQLSSTPVGIPGLTNLRAPMTKDNVYFHLLPCCPKCQCHDAHDLHIYGEVMLNQKVTGDIEDPDAEGGATQVVFFHCTQCYHQWYWLGGRDCEESASFVPSLSGFLSAYGLDYSHN